MYSAALFILSINCFVSSFSKFTDIEYRCGCLPIQMHSPYFLLHKKHLAMGSSETVIEDKDEKTQVLEGITATDYLKFNESIVMKQDKEARHGMLDLEIFKAFLMGQKRLLK
ncbi:hypothetical protein L2E82_15243 [Cichorium intybus]|uniref:Uncharacterized protein n=1 Tax=Cichorium intybus TaxID=13427 RepID=A0ACB9F2T3_CICIN|nr:hypothetical protein L2E82_15243 [Cichorium intybus]